VPTTSLCISWCFLTSYAMLSIKLQCIGALFCSKKKSCTSNLASFCVFKLPFQ
jgi:hypothetical protein